MVTLTKIKQIFHRHDEGDDDLIMDTIDRAERQLVEIRAMLDAMATKEGA